MSSNNSFENLVSDLTVSERQEILDKMLAGTPAENDGEVLAPVEERVEVPEISLAEELKKQPLYVKIYLWIKAIFTSTNAELLYNEIKINTISKNVSRNFPGLIDTRRGLFLSAFYEKLEELKACAEFFRPYIVSIEADESNFFVFLGSLIMQNSAAELKADADPYSNPVTSEARPELRVELLRKMDDIFQNITREEKNKMYDSVKSVEWLRQFVKLPVSRLLSAFSNITDGIYTCPFSQIEREVNLLAKNFCTGFRMSDEVIEAFYLFSEKKTSKFTRMQDDEDSIDQSAAAFVAEARNFVAKLHMFMNSVPMYSIGCIVSGDSRWQPANFTGVEDWFVKYKNYWKKIFEQRWESWVQACKKENLRIGLETHFGLEAFPYLPERPWLDLWGGFPFRYELTSGFIFWYFREKFPTFEIALKSVLVEGSFVKKENQIAFTDAFNDFIQTSINMTAVVNKLKANGEVGLIFAKLKDEHLRTLQGQTKIEQLMRSVESDVSSVIHKFCDSIRIMDAVVCGILGLRKDSRYDSLANLSHLQGRDNEKFLKLLDESAKSFENALDLIKELETVDAPV